MTSAATTHAATTHAAAAPERTSRGRISRRGLLTGGLSGGLLLAFHVPLRAANEPVQPPDATESKFAPNAFIRIDETGTTTLVMPQVEMGQGVYTSIPMILAEELDADFSQVTLLHAPASDKLYANPTFGIQVTGNSNSIRTFWKPLREAGASARAMLVQAAAAQWQVEPASCTTSNGIVTHKESGRTLTYGATRRRRRQADASERGRAKGSEGFRSDRHGRLKRLGHAGQSQRQGGLRHRCDAPGHEVRDLGPVSRIRRQDRQGRR